MVAPRKQKGDPRLESGCVKRRGAEEGFGGLVPGDVRPPQEVSEQGSAVRRGVF